MLLSLNKLRDELILRTVVVKTKRWTVPKRVEIVTQSLWFRSSEEGVSWAD